ncbi:aldose 1-epimerase family protein [Klugiella xanthotipulae]|uniref:Aldose 1-epimerase n=1 Tax=Klugiella xanthotipulae TaxID=244735 RepID=A0A543I518_9MICO|nr:aldose 1-epimerase family protein [Klugiella xanthotipulae]TQM65667.1 aldose 1-epimerase [Klugiella xanthotipulae]
MKTPAADLPAPAAPSSPPGYRSSPPSSYRGGMSAAPTGEQFELTARHDGVEWRAVVTERAAGLRILTADGIDLVEPFPAEQMPPFAAGIVLVPWPNRVRDGVWHLHGAAQQLDLTEVSRGNAIHGLLRNAPYRVVDRSAASLTLGAPLYPQHGYPFRLDTRVTYELVGDGIRVTHAIQNLSDAPAPVALGAHPFLRIGGVPTGELTLTVNAHTVYTTDSRMNVTGSRPVEGSDRDLRGGVRVSALAEAVGESGALGIDAGFGGLEQRDGVTEHTLTAPDGRRLTVWGDQNIRCVQVFTTRAFGTDTVTDVAVAIEPMTAPGGALASGENLEWVLPGAEWVVTWGIRFASSAVWGGIEHAPELSENS